MESAISSPCSPPSLVLKCHTHTFFEHFQEWWLHFPEKPVAMLLVKEFCFISNLNLLWCNLRRFPQCPLFLVTLKICCICWNYFSFTFSFWSFRGLKDKVQPLLSDMCRYLPCTWHFPAMLHEWLSSDPCKSCHLQPVGIPLTQEVKKIILPLLPFTWNKNHSICTAWKVKTFLFRAATSEQALWDTEALWEVNVEMSADIPNITGCGFITALALHSQQLMYLYFSWYLQQMIGNMLKFSSYA